MMNLGGVHGAFFRDHGFFSVGQMCLFRIILCVAVGVPRTWVK